MVQVSFILFVCLCRSFGMSRDDLVAMSTVGSESCDYNWRQVDFFCV